MQITTGIRSIFSHPFAYRGFQYLMGAHQGWITITQKYMRVKKNDAVLDIGCGLGDVLAYLPEVDYWGFDISPEYIAKAKQKFGHRGHFQCKKFAEGDLAKLPLFDVVLLSGVLHHLDDDQARELASLIWRALKNGGRLVTVDPCFAPQQNYIARFLIKHDRGRNVREAAGYQALVKAMFQQLEVNVIHKVWIPYSHCFMVGTK